MNRRLTTRQTLSDFYCGAGGSSTGAVAAGAEVTDAANHSALAIKTHNHNHPETNHHLCDLLLANPARFPYTVLAWFSPMCTPHTLSAGQKRKGAHQLGLFEQKKPDPEAERSRVTMWDVVRFSEYHHYEVVIIENVVDIKYWPPYNAWLQAMESLGYTYKVCYFNSMFFHPLNGQSDFAPQSRDRIYVVFWRKGNKKLDLDFRPLAWCSACEKNVRAVQVFKKPVFPRGHYDNTGKRGQYYYGCPECLIKENGSLKHRRVEPYYYAAYNAIDWRIPMTKIGDRTEPLEENTLRRIRIGLERFGRQPLLVEICRSHAQNNRSVTLGHPTPSQTTQQSLAFIMPFKGDPESQHIRPATAPLPVQTTAGGPAVVSVPMIVDMYQNGDARPVTEVVNTVTAGGIRSGLVIPSNLIPDSSSDDFALIMPYTPFIASYYNGSDMVHGIDQAVGTIPTVDRHSLVLPETDLESCGFRMLEPDECKDAQGFPESYVIYGNRKQQIKQIGNAVSPPPAEFLVRAGIESLS